MNDPYEQGWYARPGYDFNPYERGTKEHERWEAGHEERNAQPDHYDESKDPNRFDPRNSRKHPGGVDEGSMEKAAHNPEGPKFGGYYGATQKGPPKPGQGFGGAAESVGATLDEVAPPGMEDMVMKLKKQYPGEPAKAFATAWSIYNKKKGKK
jgi:hypothetical protein